LAQHLFIAPHNLVLDGTSDYTYLLLISSFLVANNRTGIDERWSLVPVGGADLVPSFVALLGNHARHNKQDRFDHGRPADVMLRQRDAFLPSLSSATLDRFEKLFSRINETMGAK